MALPCCCRNAYLLNIFSLYQMFWSKKKHCKDKIKYWIIAYLFLTSIFNYCLASLQFPLLLFFFIWICSFSQTQFERDELYDKFVKAIHEVQQKSNFKNLLLEKKLSALADTLEKKEAQLNEVLSASNLDPTALTVVTRKLEVLITISVIT